MWPAAAVAAGFDKTDREFGGTGLGPVLHYLLSSVTLLLNTPFDPPGAGSR